MCMISSVCFVLLSFLGGKGLPTYDFITRKGTRSSVNEQCYFRCLVNDYATQTARAENGTTLFLFL